MKSLILAIGLFLPSFAPGTAVVVPLGESLTINALGSAAIRVSSRRAVQIVDQGKTVEVWGKRIGSAMITQGNRQWYVHVLSKPTAELYRLISGALEEMLGLILDIEDGQVVVRGQLLRLSDWELLAKLQKHTGGNWAFKAAIDRSISETSIRKLLSLPSQWRLELSPTPQIYAPSLAKNSLTLQAFGVAPQATLSTTPQSSVRLRLILAEVMKSASERIGLSYEDGQAAEILPKLKGPQTLEAKLNYLADTGQARILAKPSLVARPNTEAEFLAGGEFAIRTSSYRNKDVSWKRHGLWIRFRPEWRSGNVVAIKVETEFSHPDYSHMVDGIPSLRSHKTSTNVDLEIGRTLLLAGLIHSQQGDFNSGLSGLKDIPILGALFGSRDYANNRSELMVFVKPEVAATDSNDEMPEGLDHATE